MEKSRITTIYIHQFCRKGGTEVFSNSGNKQTAGPQIRFNDTFILIFRIPDFWHRCFRKIRETNNDPSARLHFRVGNIEGCPNRECSSQSQHVLWCKKYEATWSPPPQHTKLQAKMGWLLFCVPAANTAVLISFCVTKKCSDFMFSRPTPGLFMFRCPIYDHSAPIFLFDILPLFDLSYCGEKKTIGFQCFLHQNLHFIISSYLYVRTVSNSLPRFLAVMLLSGYLMDRSPPLFPPINTVQCVFLCTKHMHCAFLAFGL